MSVTVAQGRIVMNVGFYNTSAYYKPNTVTPHQAQVSANAKPDTAGDSVIDNAAIVTISEAARNAVAEPDFAQVLTTARDKLTELLAEAERSSPLENGRLALDMTQLNNRELHAIRTTTDGLFTTDEGRAAELEMQRRFENALTGPLAISELTSDYRPLYRAAAQYLDALGTEEKAEPAWKDARAAIDAALAQLAGDKTTPPAEIANDPVAAFLKTRDASGDDQPTDPMAIEDSLRAVLDKQYEKARAAGQQPTFDPSNKRGALIDLAAFDAETISAMSFNRKGLFSADEVRAASNEIRNRASVALAEGYRAAAKSSDPTAFARNIIAIYSSLSPDVRQAAGFSDKMLSTAVSSYEATSRLLDVMSSHMQGGSGVASWFGGR